MDQWEYLSIFLEADAKDKHIKQFIEQTFGKKARRYSPEALIPALNELGIDGWEIVHMEPVPQVGRKENIQFDPYHWSNNYFCVFKRAIEQPETFPEAQMMTAQSAEDEVEIPPLQLDPNRIPY